MTTPILTRSGQTFQPGHDVSDQPRDERGRFGPSGGDGGKGAPAAAPLSTPAKFLADLKSKGVEGDFSGLEGPHGLNDQAVGQMKAAFDRTWQDFPILHGNLESIQTAATPGTPPTAVAAVGDSFAVTGLDPETGHPMVVLNPTPGLWSEEGLPGTMTIDQMHRGGYGVGENPGDVLTHELGHAVMASWPGGSNQFADMVSRAATMTFANRTSLGDAVSAYALSSRDEMFGELFAANNIPGYKESLASEAMRPENSAALITEFADRLNTDAASKLAARGLPPQRVI